MELLGNRQTGLRTLRKITSFVFVDINEDALKNAEEIREKNGFKEKIELRKSENAIFKGVIKTGEKYVGVSFKDIE